MRVCHVSASASPSVACLCLYVWTSVCGLRGCPAAAALRAARRDTYVLMLRRARALREARIGVWPWLWRYGRRIPLDDPRGSNVAISPVIFARFVVVVLVERGRIANPLSVTLDT